MSDGPVTAILLAAGSSSRMGETDKLWVDLGGRPLVAWPLETLGMLSDVSELVVVAPESQHEALEELAQTIGCAGRTRYVAGGERRRDSVAAGMAAAADARWYIVHDAARPLASVALAGRVLAAAREHGAAVPGLAVADTIKRVDPSGRVLETLDRAALRAIQTPQAFEADLLRRAHAATDGDTPDDAALVEALGSPVQVVDGEGEAMKVTTLDDLKRVRALIAGDAQGERGGR